MSNEFLFTVIDPQHIIYEGKVTSLVIPCTNGLIGILASHAPLCARTVPGEILIKEGSSAARKIVLDESGFFEVRQNKATLLLG